MRHAVHIQGTGSLKGGDHWEDLDADVTIILKLIVMKQNGRVWTGFISLRMGTNCGHEARNFFSFLH